MGAGRLRRSRRCLERCELSELALDLGDIEGEQEGWPGDGLDFGSGVMGRVTVKDKLLVGVKLKGHTVCHGARGRLCPVADGLWALRRYAKNPPGWQRGRLQPAKQLNNVCTIFMEYELR